MINYQRITTFMKALLVLFLLCASVYGADTTSTNIVGDITTETSERTKDGKPYVRIETVYRDKTKILQTLSRPNKQGVLAVTSRSFLVGGERVLIESDEDGDGVFEHRTLFRPGTDDLEMFRLQPGGAVKPVSTQTIEATKKQTSAVNEAMRRLIGKENLSDQEISNTLQQTRQAVQDLQKQRRDDEK